MSDLEGQVMCVTEERLLTKSEVAYKLGVSEKTIDRLVASNKLAARKIGGRLRFEPAEIDRYIEASRLEQPEAG